MPFGIATVAPQPQLLNRTAGRQLSLRAPGEISRVSISGAAIITAAVRGAGAAQRGYHSAAAGIPQVQNASPLPASPAVPALSLAARQRGQHRFGCPARN